MLIQIIYSPMFLVKLFQIVKEMHPSQILSCCGRHDDSCFLAMKPGNANTSSVMKIWRVHSDDFRFVDTLLISSVFGLFWLRVVALRDMIILQQLYRLIIVGG